MFGFPAWQAPPPRKRYGGQARVVAAGQGASDEEDDLTFAVLSGLALLAAAALITAPGPRASVPAVLSQAVLAADVGFSVLPDGRGGANVESVVLLDAMKDIIVGKSAYVGRFRQ